MEEKIFRIYFWYLFNANSGSKLRDFFRFLPVAEVAGMVQLIGFQYVVLVLSVPGIFSCRSGNRKLTLGLYPDNSDFGLLCGSHL